MPKSAPDPDRGLLIVVDGIDGVGKTSQIDGIANWFAGRGRTVTRVRDPGGTEIGGRLRELLLSGTLPLHRRTEALLFMASRSELVDRVIAPEMRRGGVVLSDRYLLSTVVYQSIGDVAGGVGGPLPDSVSTADLWSVGRWAAGRIDPDLTILLDMPAADAYRRIGDYPDRMESRGIEYLESVRQSYLANVSRTGGEYRIIDAGQPREPCYRGDPQPLGRDLCILTGGCDINKKRNPNRHLELETTVRTSRKPS